MEDVISSADVPAAQGAALPARLDEEDALALELCASQIEALSLRAEAVAERRAAIERRIETKYRLRVGVDTVDLTKRTITRG